ncbi:hypothetical protein QBC35DRAFT_95739 [Podospora australis]|uniref:Uncharacterized protein n=1 Tax=Podospora australis TaxID=1536484 RepID=A0AAN6X154_9PEZI|nr:hypothetical protein QBC35DRAFT_95739 [Podospora australis]
MASVDPSPTLKFLTDAAHLLATAAPETSAYLMSQRNGLMFEHELTLPETHRQHICTCCGHILLLGLDNSSLYIKAVKPPKRNFRIIGKQKDDQKTRKQERQTKSSGPTKNITCCACGSLTKIQLPAPALIPQRKVTKTLPAVSGMASSTSSAKPSGSSHPSQQQSTQPNAASKKRSKSKKAGLQALLEQNKNSRPGLGLSLADFMSK